MMDISSVFMGVPQSRYAALAILLAIVVVSLAILFGKDPIPMSQKFGFVLLVFLVSLPGLLLSLFQLTCIVTGAGFKKQRWWCSLYAWVLSAIMIFYAVILIMAAIVSLTAPPVVAPVANKASLQSNLKDANAHAEHFFAGGAAAPPPPPSPPPTGAAPSPDSMPPSIAHDNGFMVKGGQDVAAPFPGKSEKSLHPMPGAQLNGVAAGPEPSTAETFGMRGALI